MNVPTPIPSTLTPASMLGAEPIILFAANDDLWQTDTHGNRVERITDGRILNWRMGQGDDWLLAATQRPPQASPDGRWITLSSTGHDVILIDVATGLWQQVSKLGAPMFTWSPDSRYVAYSPDSSLSPTSDDLYLYDVQNQQSHHLLQLDKDDGVGIVSMVWSPDGRFIAFGCCFNIDTGNNIFTGKVQQIELATGDMETVGEIWSSIGGGSPELCWTVDGPMLLENIQKIDETSSCSHRQRSDTRSPDGTLAASLSPASSDDEFWAGPSLLTVKMVSTGSILWQREIEESVKRIVWSLDSQHLLLDNNQNESPIWRIKADGDGLSEFEIVVDDGYLLDVIPQGAVVTKIISDDILPSPTPFTCTPLPEGMTLDLNPLSSILVEIVVQGLQPGEEITVIFTARSPGHNKLIENSGILIGSDGKYSSQEILRPLPESDENHWEAVIIHAHGVACADVTLPSDTN